MKTFKLLQHRAQQIRRLVEAHNARNPRGFGSVLQGDDTAKNDIDILVESLPEMSELINTSFRVYWVNELVY